MFSLKNDAFLSKAKKGGTLGFFFEDIKTLDSVQNITQKSIQLDSEWSSINKIICSRPIVKRKTIPEEQDLKKSFFSAPS